MTDKIDFIEVQRFKIWWAWVTVAALNVLCIYAIVQQLILGKAFGPKPASNSVLLMAGLFVFLLLLFLMSIKLKTRITETGIYYRFYPFQFKETCIEWQELKNAWMREYNALFEYGGFGLRSGSAQTGKAVITSASCNMGLQLQFNGDQLLLIGTQKPQEMQIIIDAVMASGKINRRI